MAIGGITTGDFTEISTAAAKEATHAKVLANTDSFRCIVSTRNEGGSNTRSKVTSQSNRTFKIPSCMY